jgi:hypothetical protein
LKEEKRERVVEWAATQGVPPEAKMSHGAARTKGMRRVRERSVWSMYFF